MNKEEILQVMCAAFNKANSGLCEQAGLSEEEIDAKISESEMAVSFLLKEVLSELEEKNLLRTP
jgi:hypothetical protein